MNLKNILKDIDIKPGIKMGNINISNVTDDSRKVIPGSLFIAAKGCSLDGAKFIKSAIGAGAKVVVAEKDFNFKGGALEILVDDTRSALNTIADNFYGHPSGMLKVTGITGTNGKTTITYILESIIKSSGSDAGIIGTINYRLKDKIFPAINTTPGAIVLQRMLAEMVRMKMGYAIMEVSSHSLDQGRSEKIRLDVAIFTNVTSDHLDYHKTTTNYFNAKKKIFKHLKPRGVAVLNVDDKKVASLKRSINNRVITYGIKQRADVMARDIKLSMHGSSFIALTPIGEMAMRTKLIGAHNISNILAALASAIALKLPKTAIIKGIESMERVPGRLEEVVSAQKFKVFVDFAHTEDALANVLGLLKGLTPKRILTVFGCGGDRDKTKRPKMGKIACKYSDHVIVTSDNPRFEDPGSILSDIERGIKGRFTNYNVVPGRRDAISVALKSASEGDIVLIAGKGHENYQIIRGRSLPFDDRNVALSILRKMESK